RLLHRIDGQEPKRIDAQLVQRRGGSRRSGTRDKHCAHSRLTGADAPSSPALAAGEKKSGLLGGLAPLLLPDLALLRLDLALLRPDLLFFGPDFRSGLGLAIGRGGKRAG